MQKCLTDAQLKRALKDFGAHIAYLRRQKGWSQEELSFETGLARSYLSGIECGKRNPSLMTIVCLAVALGVSMSEVVGQRG